MGFEEICNLRWFLTTAMILFLNKKDLFAAKIQKVPLSVCFDEYDGDDIYDDCVGFIRTRFESKNKNPREKQVYSHVTMATDKTNVERVFGDVQHIVINMSLACVLICSSGVRVVSLGGLMNRVGSGGRF